MEQDELLCEEIAGMRHFQRVYEKSKHARKDMTQAEWAYLEAVDELVNG